jgi:cell division protein FtsB
MRIALWAVLAGALFMMFLAVLAAWHVFVKERDAKRGLDVANSNLAELEARKGDLETKLKALSTERGIEEVIRERFPVAKRGEEVITIVNPTGSGSQPTTTAPKGLWETVSSWFAW